MNLLDFYRQYSNETSYGVGLCYFYEHRDLFCKQCGCLRLRWNLNNNFWTCIDCKHEVQLRSDTVMRDTYLFMCGWFTTIFFLITTKHAILLKKQDQLECESLCDT